MKWSFLPLLVGIAGALWAAGPPRCDPGKPQSFRAGSPVQLDGSRSQPGDGSRLSYSWQQIPSELADIPMQRLRWSSPEVPQPVVTGTVAGPLNFQLTVTQGDGQQSTCAVHDGRSEEHTSELQSHSFIS